MGNSVIYLIGYRGTGKSTVARLLAERLDWDWCDADAELERTFGKTIRQIFAESGEPDLNQAVPEPTARQAPDGHRQDERTP